MTAFDTELLADLIERKRACLVQLRDMGKKQLEVVVDGSMTELLDVLAAKQRVLGELQRVELALAPFRGQDPDQRTWHSPQRRQQCAGGLRQCEALLREIVQREKQSEQALVERRDETAARLQGVHAASQARGAYVAQPGQLPSQLDLMSES